ncbi:MAG: peptide chain release factor N(5)-glutamine methyltransferase [Hyphomicrobiaceae bacterium]|nr:MAG: peptide chain release factor N(5)-glutamine methyltransferase [Hyphomicrobiaceae bacterium]
MNTPEHEAALPTVAVALRQATAALSRAGIEGAGNDARRLLVEATGLSSAQVLARPEEPLTLEQSRTFLAYVERRAQRAPLSRILGVREFYGRPFKLSPATLDPRPDSETLITAALGLAREEGWLDTPLRILDVGTGTGCLLLTLLSELPKATGLGTDISPVALDTASENAQRLGVADRADWRIADALDGVVGPFDILISNPPYIRSGDIADLEREVRDFDPIAALDGGSDGLRVYRRLADAISSVIPDGWIILEVGYDQADAVAGLLMSSPTRMAPDDIRYFRDVAGKRRCVAGRTRN